MHPLLHWGIRSFWQPLLLWQEHKQLHPGLYFLTQSCRISCNLQIESFYMSLTKTRLSVVFFGSFHKKMVSVTQTSSAIFSYRGVEPGIPGRLLSGAFPVYALHFLCMITNKIFLVSCWTTCLSCPEIIDFSFDFLGKRIKPYFFFGNKQTWFFSLENLHSSLDSTLNTFLVKWYSLRERTLRMRFVHVLPKCKEFKGSQSCSFLIGTTSLQLPFNSLRDFFFFFFWGLECYCL